MTITKEQEKSVLESTKKYIELDTSVSEENVLCLEVRYSLGGHNWYNGDNERRGYYLYCSPCTRTTRSLNDGKEYTTISETLGKGAKVLLKEVTRQSQKAETEAVKIAAEKEAMLVETVVKKYDLKMKEVQE